MTPDEGRTQAPEIDWTPYAELHLINSLGGLKAIGINHHFFMAIVWHRFTSAMHVAVSPETLKKRLETFYDFTNADKLVAEIPFPNDVVDFTLPEDDFPGLRLAINNSVLQQSHSKSTPDSRSSHSQANRKETSKRFSSHTSTPLSSKGRSFGDNLITNYMGSGKRGGGTKSPLTTGESFKKRQHTTSDEKRKVSTTPPLPTRGPSPATILEKKLMETPRGFEKKLLKDSRVVLTKSKIDDMPTVKRGIKMAEEDKRQTTSATISSPSVLTPSSGSSTGTTLSGVSTGKKRQYNRLSDSASKSSSPTPVSKRGRH